MITHVKQCKRLFYFFGFLLENNKRLLNTQKPLEFLLNTSSQGRLFSVFQIRSMLLTNDSYQLILSRNKSKGREKKRAYTAEEDDSDGEEDEQDSDEDEEQFLEDSAEIKTYNINSLRIDSVLKTVFGDSRKKIEKNFYENKIRLNGNLLLKKSYTVKEDDELDVIKKVEDHCENTLKVGRIKILKVKFDSESNRYMVKAWRAKSLVIENYDGVHSWKENEEIN